MYDTEYIRELTAARKANEVARALIKDHERTIVAQREAISRLRAALEQVARMKTIKGARQIVQDALRAQVEATQ